MHDHIMVTDNNVYSIYHTINYITNTVAARISLFKSVVLKMGSHDLFSVNLKTIPDGFPLSRCMELNKVLPMKFDTESFIDQAALEIHYVDHYYYH